MMGISKLAYIIHKIQLVYDLPFNFPKIFSGWLDNSINSFAMAIKSRESVVSLWQCSKTMWFNLSWDIALRKYVLTLLMALKNLSVAQNYVVSWTIV